MLYYSPLDNKLSSAPGQLSVAIGLPRSESPTNSAFDKGVQFAWDSVSIGLLKTCPRKYYFTVVKGYVPKITPPPLAFGIHLHTLLQTWYKLLDANLPRDTALIRIVRLAGLLGETLPAGDNARTKETLVRAIVWYLEQFWNDPAKTVSTHNGSPAVEYSFKLPLMEYAGRAVYLCGHIDRLVQWQGSIYDCDYKTTKYTLDGKFFDKFKPSTQIPLYVSATHLIAETMGDLPSAHGAIIDGIQLGVNFCRFSRHVISFSPEEINEYIEGLQYWIQRGMDACQAGYFPANEESCSQYGGCHFRDICAMPPARRKAYLDGNFAKQTWNPLERR